MSASFEDNCKARHSLDDGVLEKSLVRAMKLCSRSEKCSSQIRQYLQRLSFTSQKGRCRCEHTECEDPAQASCSSGTAGIRRLEPEEIELVLKRLEEEGFVDDRRFALAYTKDKMHLSRWGGIKVRNCLVHFGIDSKLIDEALSTADESGQKDNLHLLIEGKLRSLLRNENLHSLKYEQKQKIYAKVVRYALGRGYGYSEIMAELGTISVQKD